MQNSNRTICLGLVSSTISSLISSTFWPLSGQRKSSGQAGSLWTILIITSGIRLFFQIRAGGCQEWQIEQEADREAGFFKLLSDNHGNCFRRTKVFPLAPAHQSQKTFSGTCHGSSTTSPLIYCRHCGAPLKFPNVQIFASASAFWIAMATSYGSPINFLWTSRHSPRPLR